MIGKAGREVRELVRHVMVDHMQMQEFERDPLILSRGEGIYVWDIEGNRYIDGISGVWVVNIGHGNRRVIDTMTQQLNRLAFASPVLATNERMLELADQLLELVPSGMTTVKFQTGGSEAIEAAIKLARQYHRQTGAAGKYKIITRYQSYHGATLGALSATGSSVHRRSYEPLAPGFLHVPAPDSSCCTLCAAGSACTSACADRFDEMIRSEGLESVAAVMVEPVMNMAGVIAPPRAYMERLRVICDRYNVLLIYDEVLTGFGRLGTRFGADYFGVWPDLLCVGKGITSGYAPLSGVIIDERVADAFRGEPDQHVEFHSGHTYGGNPVACAAALAAISELEERRLAMNASAMGARLHAGLEQLQQRHTWIRAVRAVGLLCAIELAVPPEADGPAVMRQIASVARHRGLLVRTSPAGLIQYGPPLIVTPTQIDEIVAITDAVLGDVLPAVSHVHPALASADLG